MTGFICGLQKLNSLSIYKAATLALPHIVPHTTCQSFRFNNCYFVTHPHYESHPKSVIPLLEALKFLCPQQTKKPHTSHSGIFRKTQFSGVLRKISGIQSNNIAIPTHNPIKNSGNQDLQPNSAKPDSAFR